MRFFKIWLLLWGLGGLLSPVQAQKVQKLVRRDAQGKLIYGEAIRQLSTYPRTRAGNKAFGTAVTTGVLPVTLVARVTIPPSNTVVTPQPQPQPTNPTTTTALASYDKSIESETASLTGPQTFTFADGGSSGGAISCCFSEPGRYAEYSFAGIPGPGTLSLVLTYQTNQSSTSTGTVSTGSFSQEITLQGLTGGKSTVIINVPVVAGTNVIRIEGKTGQFLQDFVRLSGSVVVTTTTTTPPSTTTTTPPSSTTTTGGGSTTPVAYAQSIESETATLVGPQTGFFDDGSSSGGKIACCFSEPGRYAEYSFTGIPGTGSLTLELQYQTNQQPGNGSTGTVSTGSFSQDINLEGLGGGKAKITLTVPVVSGTNVIRIAGKTGQFLQDYVKLSGTVNGTGGTTTPPSSTTTTGGTGNVTGYTYASYTKGLIVGNSITTYRASTVPNEWPYDNAMAVDKPELDNAHIIQKALQGVNPAFQLVIKGQGSGLEQAYNSSDNQAVTNTLSNLTFELNQDHPNVKFDPFIFSVGENFSGTFDATKLRSMLDRLLAAVPRPTGGKVIFRTSFWSGSDETDAFFRTYCAEKGILLADISSYKEQADLKASQYTNNAGWAHHPNDKGHARIAASLLEPLKIPANTTTPPSSTTTTGGGSTTPVAYAQSIESETATLVGPQTGFFDDGSSSGGKIACCFSEPARYAEYSFTGIPGTGSLTLELQYQTNQQPGNGSTGTVSTGSFSQDINLEGLGGGKAKITLTVPVVSGTNVIRIAGKSGQFLQDYVKLSGTVNGTSSGGTTTPPSTTTTTGGNTNPVSTAGYIAGPGSVATFADWNTKGANYYSGPAFRTAPAQVPANYRSSFNYPLPAANALFWSTDQNSKVLGHNRKAAIGPVVRLDGGSITVEVRLRYGGGVAVIDKSNNYQGLSWIDHGRQAEITWYGGPNDWSSKYGGQWHGIGYDPIGVGNTGEIGSPVQAVAYVTGNDNNTYLYVKNQLLNWPSGSQKEDGSGKWDDEITGCWLERWIRAEDGKAIVKARITHDNPDRKYYGGYNQEWPNFMIAGSQRQVAFATGAPGSGITYSDLVEQGPNDNAFLASKGVPRPFQQTPFNVSEPWQAVNANGKWWGIVGQDYYRATNTAYKVWDGVNQGADGGTDEGANPATYVSAQVMLEAGPDVTYYTDYTIMVNSDVNVIRSYANSIPLEALDYNFNQSRGNNMWFCNQGHQTGLGDNNGWPVSLGQYNRDAGGETAQFASISSPVRRWQASGISTIYVKMAYTGNKTSLNLGWLRNGQNPNNPDPNRPNSEAARFPGGSAVGKNSISFGVTGDGAVRTYAIPVSNSGDWQGVIQQIYLNGFQTAGEPVRLLYVGVNNPN